MEKTWDRVPRPTQHKPQSKAAKENAALQTFSPFMQSLLQGVMQETAGGHRFLSLLQDLYPYADKEDRAAIRSFFGPPCRIQSAGPSLPDWSSLPGPPLCRRDRLKGILGICIRHGGQKTAASLAPILRILEMESRLTRIRQGGMGELLPLLGMPGLDPAMMQMLAGMMK